MPAPIPNPSHPATKAPSPCARRGTLWVAVGGEGSRGRGVRASL